VQNAWHPNGIRLAGVVHSHPRGYARPSGGDLEYLEAIFRANPKLQFFELPIVQTGHDGEFSIAWWRAVRAPGSDRPELVLVEPEHPTMPTLSLPNDFQVTDSTFDRVVDAYDMPLMGLSRVGVAGCGGAVGWVLDLARAGVGHFVLIDPDVFEASNIGTQHVSRRHLGRSKVEALAEEIRDVNPNAVVVAIRKRVEEIGADEVRQLLCAPVSTHPAMPTMLKVGQKRIASRIDVQVRPLATLLAGMTDSHAAQAHVVRCASTLNLPVILAQVYARGLAAEIVFHHPDGPLAACPKCVLHSRYEAYKGGFVNNVTSHGTPICATTHLNAVKFKIAMAMLHHGHDHGTWGGLIERIGSRNLVQIRLHPDCELPAFKQLSHERPNLLGFGDTLFFKVSPRADCTCCGTQHMQAAAANVA
jgi:ThiF family